ncbi:MAG: NADH-quinone oxidoreductase subunit L [Pseudomonadales bacterium]
MLEYIWLIPVLPLLSSVVLILSAGKLPGSVVSILGVGSVGLSALLVLSVVSTMLPSVEPYQISYWTWMQVGSFAPRMAFYIDGLSLVMMSVITGVGFLIHLYSSEFMQEDTDFSRYFAYLNMFVAAMLILVMADNLLLLYLGWEGVGVCSYLLVGFWYTNSANGRAARKAFVVTRVGDTAMALGLLLLFTQLGTLDIQPLMQAAELNWAVGSQWPTIAAALLLGGALGKSAQLPLQTWLPDAMAGPTPVSALIHAATMVTAGVYLIARTHGLFLLAPDVLACVALIGLATLLVAAFSALNQNDIKRILAYSTISQIGYMFLALGVGAWSASVFHLMTHAFFKALLFLAAGAVIHCLHHEHDIFKMGGLRSKLPIPFWSFLIGSAALAALPFTSGFYSKDQILMAAWEVPSIGPLLWLGGLLGALITAIYSFRLVFVVFFGDATTEPDRQPGWRMALPLILLCGLSIAGGWIKQPLSSVFPLSVSHHPSLSIEAISVAVPLIGLALAYFLFLGKQLNVSSLVNSSIGQSLHRFWKSGWKMDSLYELLIEKPYQIVTTALKPEWADHFYHALVDLCQQLNRLLSESQTGLIRWNTTGMVVGLIILIAVAGGFV